MNKVVEEFELGKIVKLHRTKDPKMTIMIYSIPEGKVQIPVKSTFEDLVKAVKEFHGE